MCFFLMFYVLKQGICILIPCLLRPLLEMSTVWIFTSRLSWTFVGFVTHCQRLVMAETTVALLLFAPPLRPTLSSLPTPPESPRPLWMKATPP